MNLRFFAAALAFEGAECATVFGHGTICCGTGYETGEHCCNDFGSPCISCGNSNNGVNCTQADGQTHNCPCGQGECHMPEPPGVQTIEVSYELPRSNKTLGSGDGDTQEYKLAYDSNNNLFLVAQKTGLPRNPSCDPVGPLHYQFKKSHGGIFDGAADVYAFCLKVDGEENLGVTYNPDKTPCTKDNVITDNHVWTFTTDALPVVAPLCMGNWEDGTPTPFAYLCPPKATLDQTKCGPGWTQKVIDPPSNREVVSDPPVEPDSCSGCRMLYGVFACLDGHQTCTVTPDSLVCKDQPVNGIWCSPTPAPTPSPTPAPTPSTPSPTPPSPPPAPPSPHSGSVCCGTGYETGEHCCNDFGSPCISCGNSTNGVTCTQADGQTHNCPCGQGYCHVSEDGGIVV